MTDFGKAEVRSARNDYVCEWCDEDIPSGSRYIHAHGHWDGQWREGRMHEGCFEDYSDEDGGWD